MLYKTEIIILARQQCSKVRRWPKQDMNDEWNNDGLSTIRPVIQLLKLMTICWQMFSAIYVQNLELALVPAVDLNVILDMTTRWR